MTNCRILGWLLGAGYVVCYLVASGLRPLSLPDETRYALISWEMLTSGDWVVPRLLGLRYFEKPVGGYWLENLSQMVFGHNNFAVRLPSALAAGLTGLLVFWLARRGLKDIKKGLLAATIYLSSFGVFGMGCHAVLDSMLTLWLTAALAAFWAAYCASSRRDRTLWWSLFGVACGCAFMTKGFVALAITVVAVAPFLLWQRRWRELLAYGALSVLVATVVALPWSLAIAFREPDFWNFFFFDQHIERFADAHAQHRQPFWYYLPVLLALILPWPAAAWLVVRSGIKQGLTGKDPFRRFMVLALLMPLLLLSTAKGKLATYILPCCAPFAVLMADVLLDCTAEVRRRALRGSAWVVLTASVMVLAALGIAVVGFGEHPLIAGQGLALAGMAIMACLWMAVALGMLTGRIPQLAGLALLVPCLIPALPLVPTHEAIMKSNPQATLREYIPRIPAEAKVAVAWSRLPPAVAWELERIDLLIVGSSGEFEYGLEYPDVSGRWVSVADFPAWLAAERKARQVVLFAVTDFMDRFPEADQLDRRGKLSVLWYHQRPE